MDKKSRGRAPAASKPLADASADTSEKAKEVREEEDEDFDILQIVQTRADSSLNDIKVKEMMAYQQYQQEGESESTSHKQGVPSPAGKKKRKKRAFVPHKKRHAPKAQATTEAEEEFDPMEIVKQRAKMEQDNDIYNTKEQQKPPAAVSEEQKTENDSVESKEFSTLAVAQQQAEITDKDAMVKAKEKQAMLSTTDQASSFDIMSVVEQRARVLSEDDEDSANIIDADADATPPALARAEVEALPGAFSGAPGSTLTRRDYLRYSLLGLNPEDDEGSVPASSNDLDQTLTVSSTDFATPTIQNANSDNNISAGNRGLAVANLVNEDSSRHSLLPMAEEIDESEKAETTNRRKKQLILGLGFLLMIVVVIILVVVIVVVQKDGSTTFEATNTTAFPSQAPSQAPTSIDDYVLSLFPPVTVLQINEPSSPQALAFDWLLQGTAYLPLLSEDRIKQRYALAALYFATNGDQWVYNDDWLNHSVHECLWESYGSFDDYAYGIIWLDVKYNTTCEIDPDVDLDILDDGLFQHIWMQENKVEGWLPPEFFWLTGLRSINFVSNTVAGTFPVEITQMSNLEVFGIGGNDLTGSFPVEITAMTNLTAIVVPYNQLTGTIPTEIGLLTNLKYLMLDTNFMHGSVPTEIGLLTNMDWLYLHQMPLNGTIPTEIGMLHMVRDLGLFATDVTGTIPTELGLLGQMERLWIEANSLTGTIPSVFGQLSSSQSLHLFDNQLSGEIPTELGLLGQLGYLELDVNSLTGTIPSELGRLGAFTLWLSNNTLIGNIPSELGMASSLVKLVLENNYLTGSIPEEVELLATQGSLEILRLTGNDLTGVVPEDLCYINVTEFDCQGNLCGCNCSCSNIDTMAPTMEEDGMASMVTMMTSVPSADGTDLNETPSGNSSNGET